MASEKNSTPPFFAPITDVESGDYREAMRIFVEAFPPNQRPPVEIFKGAVRAGRHLLFGGRLEGKIVAMAMLWPMCKADFILFDYMATDAPYRGRGIGAAFAKYLLDFVRQGGIGKYLLMEVENPLLGENKEEKKRRVNYYRRLGARQMKGVRYILPAWPGLKPAEMILMVMPPYPGGIMSGATVKEIVLHVYRTLYRRKDGDPIMAPFLESVGETVELI